MKKFREATLEDIEDIRSNKYGYHMTKETYNSLNKIFVGQWWKFFTKTYSKENLAELNSKYSV